MAQKNKNVITAEGGSFIGEKRRTFHLCIFHTQTIKEEVRFIIFKIVIEIEESD